MSLEFEKVVPQVAQMGSDLASRNTTNEQRTLVAGEQLMALNDLEAIWAQILVAREKDAGFRGAAPSPSGEPINQSLPLPDCPSDATILAADGSQVYPDPHGPAFYWLTNIGVFVYPHGSENLPEVVTEPQLFYREDETHDLEGRPIATATINAYRTVYEMQLLARETLRRRAFPRPLIALYDGPLLGLFMGKEIANSLQLTRDYHEAIDIFNECGAALIGYVDRPTSRFVVNTIYLMTLDPEEITRPKLQTTGPFEGLTDYDLYRHLLGPGERSGLMVQQSPQNKEYKDKYGKDQEVVFFYLNTAAPHQEPYLARIEIPMVVANAPSMVDAVHALVYSQCQITDRYPYALTRADEIAVIHAHEKRALDDMIAVELLRNRQILQASQKLSTKRMARYGRQQHEGV